MRQFALVLLLVLAAGCDYRSSPAMSQKIDGDVPVAILRQIPERAKLVKVGMTQEEAMKTLGVADYVLRGVGGGPLKNYNYEYYLRSNCVLVLGVDMSRTPPTVTVVRGGFEPAVAGGDGWKEIR